MKLTIYEGTGQVREIPVTSKRFSIGRGTDNDLSLDDKGLSRRHVLIDVFEDAVQLTDCGSQNGTIVNRQPVNGSTLLKDGDAILIGYACDIRVQIRQAANSYAWSQSPDSVVGRTHNGTRSSTNQKAGSNKVLMMAIGSILGILFIAGGLVVVFNNLNSDPIKNSQKNTDPIIQSIDPKGNETPKPEDNKNIVSPPPEQPPPPASKMVEELGAKILARISKDKQKYIFRESALRDLNQMIERLKSSSSMASLIGSVRQRKNAIAEIAKRLNLENGFAVYTILAESENRGGNSDAAILDELAFVSTTIGAGTAENAMVSLAAYKEGVGTKKSHPLLGRIRGKINPQTQRNVWYLHEHKFISDEQYNFVLKFIALGILAENPRFFGINTEPLAF